jgi:hypothetical protein
VGDVSADDLEVVPEGETRTEGQVASNQTEDKDVDAKDIARRNMVWVKVPASKEGKPA